MASFQDSHFHACGSRLTLSTPNKCTASRPMPRQQCTQKQTHPKTKELLHPTAEEQCRPQQGWEGGGMAVNPRACRSMETFLHKCSTHGTRFIKMSPEISFLHWVNKCMVEKTFRLWRSLRLSSRENQTSDFQSVVPGLAASASPGNLLEMQIDRLQTKIRNAGGGSSYLNFNKTTRQFWYWLKFKNHCSILFTILKS